MLWYTETKQDYRAAVCLAVTQAHAERAVRVYCALISAFGYNIHLLTYSVSYSFPVHTPFGGSTAVLRRMTIPVNSTKWLTIHTGRQYSRLFAYGGFYMRQKMIT